MALSELSASLPPSQFGTQRHTRNPSRVIDSREGGLKGFQGMSQGVDAQVRVRAATKAAHCSIHVLVGRHVMVAPCSAWLHSLNL